jgi:hypothetical protein
LEMLKTSAPPAAWAGHKPWDWAQFFTHETANLPRERVTRQELLEFCRQHSGEECFLTVMAWGGMNRKHGRSAWNSRHRELLKVVSEIRTANSLTRRGAYRLFWQARARKSLPGLGAAYFTKLIYFLRPGLDGYIMDQWTAKSINLLFGSQIELQLGKKESATVSDRNDDEDYERFCACVDELALALGCSGAEAEEKIFSQGRPRANHWRAHVKREWAKKYPGV